MAIEYKVNLTKDVIDLNLNTTNHVVEVKTQDIVLALSRTGGQGAQGESAYDTAVANGYVGTEASWLLSLKGEPYESAAAQAATEAARDAAIIAKNNAELSATNAATSATQASGSASNALSSANNASTSATNALTSENNAEDSETNAAQSALSATNSANSAITNAELASQSQLNAATSATNAASSANQALASANSAQGSANTATLSASNANTSKLNAETAANTATAKAQEALNSANNSASSAISASASANSANTAAISAASNADVALGYADIAFNAKENSQSAALQSVTYAGYASTSSNNAAASALSAQENAETTALLAAEVSTNTSQVASDKSDVSVLKSQVEAIYDNFDDRYLGAKTVNPTTDNDGNQLLIGSLFYFINLSTPSQNQLKIWNGSQWDNAAFNSSNSVISFNTRKGDITLSQTDIETALGYSPVAAASLSSVATSGSYSDLTNKPTIPSDVSNLTDNLSILFDKQYSSLQGRPQNLSNFTNDLDLQNTIGVEAIIQSSAPVKALQDTGEPLGFVNRTHSSVIFSNSTREFRIEPDVSSGFLEYSIWTKGVKRTYTSLRSITIPNVTGLYYIYFNPEGILSYRESYFNWETDCMVSYIYWNATTGTAPFFADERHGVVLDWQTHEYLHRTRGAAFANGFSINNSVLGGNGSSNTHAQFGLSGGTFFDEDLEVQVTHSLIPTPNKWEQYLNPIARIPVFYLSGNDWVRDAPTDYPLKQGTLRPQYNYFNGTTWATADIAEGRYGTTWIVATNNFTYPVIAIIGQHEGDLIGTAEALRWEDLNLPSFPIFEFRPLYKLIYQCDKDYTNVPKARIVAISDFRSVISTQAPSTLGTDHGLLSGLGDDDHLQYVHTTVAREVTAVHNFNQSTTFGSKTVTTIAREAISAGGDLSYNPTTGVFSYSGVTTETDPVFTASPAGAITSTQVSNWQTSYGWGNHAVAGYATQTYVNSAIAALVDSAPTTLDTLNELAAALGDDPNFATTIATAIGLKANTADLATVATSGSYNDLLSKPSLGTSSTKNVAVTGNATSDQVVLGSDTRLSDARVPVTHSQGWDSITSTPTTLSGYGITDAQPADADLTAIANLTGTNGVLKKVSNGVWELNTDNFLKAGTWTITETSGSLYFSVSGVNKMKLDVNGNLDVSGSVNTNATIT